MIKIRHIAVFIFCLYVSSTTWAQDLKSIKELVRELKDLKSVLETQNQRIAHLERLLAQGKTPTSEKKKQNPSPDEITSIPSMKKKRIEIGGELEVEFKTSEIDRHPDAVGFYDGGHRQTFDMDKADIYMKAVWNEALWTYFEIEFFESDAHIDTAFAQFEIHNDDENNFYARAGLDHQFTKYSRVTETYPISGAAFWRDEFSQIRFHGNHSLGMDDKWLYWDAMLGNSYNVDNTDSGLSENFIKANEIVQDDNDFERDSDGHLQWGVGLGITPNLGSLGALDVRVWYINGELNDNESKSGLNMILEEFFDDNGLARPSANDTDKDQLGFRLIYSNKFNNIGLKGVFEYIDAEDGFIERDAWYSELSLKFKLPGTSFGNDKWFTGLQPFVRYEDYDVDDRFDNQLAAPVTWDRQRWLIGANLSLNKLTKLRFEYLRNSEDINHRSGSRLNDAPFGNIANNEFLMQCELKF